MKKVIMLKDATGMPDGINETHYRSGESYCLPERLANCFLVMEVAKESKEMSVANEKSEPEAPKNKAINKSPKNKAEKHD